MGGKKPPFFAIIDKDYAFFILKRFYKCICVVYRSPNVCGKVLIMCGKVCDLMCLGVVILASILSPFRENVNTTRYKFCQGLTTQKYQSPL